MPWKLQNGPGWNRVKKSWWKTTFCLAFQPFVLVLWWSPTHKFLEVGNKIASRGLARLGVSIWKSTRTHQNGWCFTFDCLSDSLWKIYMKVESLYLFRWWSFLTFYCLIRQLLGNILVWSRMVWRICFHFLLDTHILSKSKSFNPPNCGA